MIRLSAKAVIAGLLTDLIGGIAVGLILASTFIYICSLSGDMSQAHYLALKSNIYSESIGFAGTTFFTGLGGYVAGKLGPNGDKMKNALVVGVISTLIGISITIALPGLVPTWKVILGVSLTIPAALIGGRLATWPQRQNLQNSPGSDAPT
ncbi:MAG TPA: hypothetical protein VKS60_04995 [Stellaceae bacterium]|nr:hypothetical protein [Stellaceae bacterium]